MPCPLCDEPKTPVIDTYRAPSGHIRRRRECAACRFRWTTEEVPIHVPVLPTRRAAHTMVGVGP
jgi:transcriptional regulator NrdR family protein